MRAIPKNLGTPTVGANLHTRQRLFKYSTLPKGKYLTSSRTLCLLWNIWSPRGQGPSYYERGFSTPTSRATFSQ